MDPIELNKKRISAVNYFNKRWKYFPKEHAEDFGSYCVEMWLSGKRKLDWPIFHIAVDYIRKYVRFRHKPKSKRDVMVGEPIYDGKEKDLILSTLSESTVHFFFIGSKLSEDEKNVLDLCFVSGETNLNTGQILGKSRQWVDRQKRSALTKVKASMEL